MADRPLPGAPLPPADALTPEQWRERCAALEAAVAALQAKVDELTARLNQDSSNSSKPPSSDPPWKQRTRRQRRERGKRKPGGQPGHKGHARELLPPEQVDEFVDVQASLCPGCGEPLTEGHRIGAPMRYQQAELPEVRCRVTEFRAWTSRCGCGEVVAAGERPEQRLCTGPRLTAAIAVLAGRYRLSRDETAALLSDLFGFAISPATVQACCERVAWAVDGAVEELEDHLADDPHLGLDETGWREAGRRAWLWVASATNFAVFRIHPKRGHQQVDAWLPTGPAGIVTSDRWSVYGRLPVEQRQLCWAHLLRDLQGLVDAGGASAAATEPILKGAVAMFTEWHRFRDGSINRATLHDRTAPFRDRLKQWAEDAAARPMRGKWRGLGRDLVRWWPAVFCFLDQRGVEPTNNNSERDLRPAVLWRRGSQGTRSPAGSLFVGHILTAWTTCKKQGRPLLDWLERAVRALHAGTDPPTLLPEST
jgi:transposase